MAATECGAHQPLSAKLQRAKLSRHSPGQTFRLLPPTHSTRLNGLWLAVLYSAHRSATMAPNQSTEFDLSKCFKGEQQLVYVYHDGTSIEFNY